MRRRCAEKSGAFCFAGERAQQSHVLRRSHVDAGRAEFAQDRDLDLALDAAAVAKIWHDAEDIEHQRGFSITVDQRFGTGHNIGKFRLSLTGDKQPKIGSPIAADVLAILDTPVEKRTPQQKEKIKGMFIAQDAEYARLQREIPIAPPADPRAVGAQDLTWALMNTPAFLFNR